MDEPIEFSADAYEALERRKVAQAARREAQNRWILENKTFAMYDIEATNLDADIGEILCACIKPLGGETKVFTAKNDDRKVVADIRDELRKYDYIVTWYGTGYDLPFTATRLVISEQEPLGLLKHVDLYYTARFHFKFHSNRLGSIAEGLFGESSKTRVWGQVWNQARSLNKKKREEAMEYIVDHCEKDVEELERIFNRLVPFRDLAGTPLRRY